MRPYVLDGHNLGLRYGGNETFVGGLAEQLSALSPEVAIYAPSAWKPAYSVMRLEPKTTSVSLQRLWDLPVQTNVLGASILHVAFALSPDYLLPRTHQVVTVHDVAFLRHPHLYRRNDYWRLRLTVERAVRKAALVVTVSQTAKQEIVETYHIDPDRVQVVFNGISDPADVSEGLPYGVPDPPFVLFVGTIQPRKGLGVLLDAIGSLRGAVKLVVVGRKGWRAKSDVERLMAAIATERVTYFPSVSPGPLRALYRKAAAVVVPSLAEGFGLPVLEALAEGTDVVASDIPVFRELYGSNPIYFSPLNARELAEAIEFALSAQHGVSSEAIQQLRETYSWRRSAAKLLNLYDQLVGV